MNDIVAEVKTTLRLAGLLNVVEWLEHTDYFTAPASASYHGAVEGGLVRHSYFVYVTLSAWTEKLGIKWKSEHSPAIIGLLHDVCKIGLYIPRRNSLGVSYTYSHSHPEGHGTLSVKMLSEHMELTDEEQAWIKYHMGTWTHDIDETLGDPSYTDMVHRFPNVLWTHTADMYASQILER